MTDTATSGRHARSLQRDNSGARKKRNKQLSAVPVDRIGTPVDRIGTTRRNNQMSRDCDDDRRSSVVAYGLGR